MQDMMIYILKGVGITVRLYSLTALFSLPLGIFMALGQSSGSSILKNLINTYTWIFRGSPLLLQLFFVYYGLPVMGITLGPLTAATLTFVLNYSAYNCEILRGGISGIDKGQYEAAKVLGFGYWQTMFKVILPQSMRTSLPALSNEAIALVKDTALVSVIGIGEILRNSREIVTREFTIVPFILCALIYLALSSIIVITFKYMERRVAI